MSSACVISSCTYKIKKILLYLYVMRRLLLFFISVLLFACSGSGDEPTTVTGIPEAPSKIRISSQTIHSVEIIWDSVSNAESYDWKLDEGSVNVRNGSTSKTKTSIDNLSEGHTYLFAVQAVNSNGKSGFSAPLTVDFGGTVPGPGPFVDGTVCVDAPLLLNLDSAPELGASGYIKVFDSADNQVDAINLADLAGVTVRDDGQMIPKAQITNSTVFNTTMDAVKSASRWRIIHYTPLRIKGNSLEIKLHNGVLNYGTEYYVTIDAGVVKGHKGVAKGEWKFVTKARPASSTELSVRQDGGGDFCTIQGAVSYAGTLGKDNSVVINIESGTYNETIFIRDKNNLTLSGTDRASTIISYANNESYETGSGGSTSAKPAIGSAIGASGGRGVILVESCDNLVIKDLTMKNTFGQQKGQAEVIYFNSPYRLTIENCALHSLQDTFLCKGIVWVHNSLIAGHCDFIWGYPKACLFEDCEIRAEAAGYIVQARVQNASDKGFVFLNCRLTAASGVNNGSMYLARSAGQSDCIDNVTYINCSMSPVIAGTGWYTSPAPNPSSPTATSGWKEFGSTDASGKAIDLGTRSRMAKVLTAEEAQAYSSKEAVLQ